MGVFSLNDLLKRNRVESNTGTPVELVLEFDPMETKGMQEALHEIHHHEHTKSDDQENIESKNKNQNVTAIDETRDQNLIEEYLGQLGMGK